MVGGVLTRVPALIDDAVADSARRRATARGDALVPVEDDTPVLTDSPDDRLLRDLDPDNDPEDDNQRPG